MPDSLLDFIVRFTCYDYSPTPSHTTVQLFGALFLLQEIDSNLHKATGPDSIPANLLKKLFYKLLLYLLIFKASVEQSNLPDDWKLGYITPIFKKGNRRSALNYRPIPLTSICCKVLEHIPQLYTSRKT